MYALPKLPYGEDALAPFMSSETLAFHHGKHHKTYVDKTNELASAAGLADLPLEDLVREAHSRADKPLFNNAAQAWNHAFFWQCMRAPGGAAPSGALAEAILAAFGGQPGLRTAFVDQGAAHFGSGWVWIVRGADGVEVITTHDADNPLTHPDVTPLLVCDLWEHAYYLDQRNDRKTYLERWFDNLANWDFAAAQLAQAT